MGKGQKPSWEQLKALLETIEQGAAENAAQEEALKELNMLLRLWVAAATAKDEHIEQLRGSLAHQDRENAALRQQVAELEAEIKDMTSQHRVALAKAHGSKGGITRQKRRLERRLARIEPVTDEEAVA